MNNFGFISKKKVAKEIAKAYGETGDLKLVTDEKESAYLMFFGTDEEMAGE